MPSNPTPRGIRNNNPGNIDRTADQWRGMAADQSGDPRFVVFQAPVWGLRAMAIILGNDIGAGKNTIRELITEWAPGNENDTESYINAVVAESGFGADEELTTAALARIMPAIVRHENGIQPYAPALFDEAIAMALPNLARRA